MNDNNKIDHNNFHCNTFMITITITNKILFKTLYVNDTANRDIANFVYRMQRSYEGKRRSGWM